MKNIFYLLIVFFLIISLCSCSSYNVTYPPLAIDSIQVNNFSSRIKNNYSDYAEISGYNRSIDSIETLKLNSTLRGPCGDINDAGYLIKPLNSEIILFTYNKNDSCVIYPAVNDDEIYWLSTMNLQVPIGQYILKYDSVETIFNHP
jgi:hypothetical protein